LFLLQGRLVRHCNRPQQKSPIPGGLESQAFQKTNFGRAPEKDWLEPGRPISENCLHEAKERAKAQLPKEPFRLTAANHADPGDSLPETDALTFFEEEILSPIQLLVRIFTLYGTGQCELRGHTWVTCFKMVLSSLRTFPQQWGI